MAATQLDHPDFFRLLTTEQAAEFLNLSPRTLQNKRLTGGGPKFIKVSHRCVRYRPIDLIRWQEQHLRNNNLDEAS